MMNIVLERDVTWRDVQIKPKYLCLNSVFLIYTIYNFKLKRKEFNKEINKDL